MNNYKKLVDDHVELVLFVDLEKGTYEIVHDAGRILWSPQIPGDYTSFLKYIEKHIEENDRKQVLRNTFSLDCFQESTEDDEAVEQDYLITMQGRYENISLLRYQMEQIAGYEHNGVLVVKLLTAEKEKMRKLAGLYQVTGSLCQMAAFVQLQVDQISFLVIPEEVKDQIVNLPKTYEGFVYELLQRIHVQDQDIVKHVLSRAYLETKFADKNQFAIQVRYKAQDEAFHDVDLICAKVELAAENDRMDFVVIMKNVTEEKKMIGELQQQIQQLENKLQEAKEEKEELCSMIAKELHRR